MRGDGVYVASHRVLPVGMENLSISWGFYFWFSVRVLYCEKGVCLGHHHVAHSGGEFFHLFSEVQQERITFPPSQ